MSFLGGLFSTLGSIGQGVGSVLGLTPWGKAAGIAGAGLGALGSSIQQDQTNKSYIAGVKDTNLTNREIADANNQMAYKQFLESNAFTQKMWNMNNQYNSPSAQAMRLRNAGINPTQMVESTPANQVSSAAAPSLSTPHMQAPNLVPTVDYGKEFSTHFNQYKDTLKQNEEIKAMRLQNYMSEVDSRYHESQVINELQIARSKVENMDMDTDHKKKLIGILDQQLYEAVMTFEHRRKGIELSNDKMETDMNYLVHKDQREERQQTINEFLANVSARVSKSQVKNLDALSQLAEQEFKDMFPDDDGKGNRGFSVKRWKNYVESKLYQDTESFRQQIRHDTGLSPDQYKQFMMLQGLHWGVEHQAIDYQFKERDWIDQENLPAWIRNMHNYGDALTKPFHILK